MSEIGRIALIGLGAMGAPMAQNLIFAKTNLRVFDLSSKARSAFGDHAAATAQEAAQGAEIVITMLPNGHIVREALFGENGALASGSVSLVIDMSSSDANGTRDLGAELEARGIGLIDAPVSGGVSAAAAGELTLMIGCDDPTLLDRAAPLFDILSSRRFHVGGIGAGHAVKSINNVLAAANLAAISEAIRLSRACAVDPGKMLEVVNASTGRSGISETLVPAHVLTERFGVGFAMGLMAKDTGLASDLIQSHSLELPVLNRVAQSWRDASEALGPTTDFSAYVKFVERCNPQASERIKA